MPLMQLPEGEEEGRGRKVEQYWIFKKKDASDALKPRGSPKIKITKRMKIFFSLTQWLLEQTTGH